MAAAEKGTEKTSRKGFHWFKWHSQISAFLLQTVGARHIIARYTYEYPRMFIFLMCFLFSLLNIIILRQTAKFLFSTKHVTTKNSNRSKNRKMYAMKYSCVCVCADVLQIFKLYLSYGMHLHWANGLSIHDIRIISIFLLLSQRWYYVFCLFSFNNHIYNTV